MVDRNRRKARLGCARSASLSGPLGQNARAPRRAQNPPDLAIDRALDHDCLDWPAAVFWRERNRKSFEDDLFIVLPGERCRSPGDNRDGAARRDYTRRTGGRVGELDRLMDHHALPGTFILDFGPRRASAEFAMDL